MPPIAESPRLIRNVRLVPVAGQPAPDGLVDLEISGGRIATLAPAGHGRPPAGRVPDTIAPAGHGRPPAGRVPDTIAPAGHGRPPAGRAPDTLDAQGRWAIPGLWDQHVHFGQWALAASRLDTSGATGPAEVLARVAARVAEIRDGRAPLPATGIVSGVGHRRGLWSEVPTVSALDAVTGDLPVVLIAGDMHHGWLNSAALRLLDVPPRDPDRADAILDEDDWYPVYARLATLPGADAELLDGYRTAMARAAAAGVVGVVDVEFGGGFRHWPERVAAGLDALRIRLGIYPEFIDEVIGQGRRTGDAIPGTHGLVTMGPLKVITDGSLNTRTAYCTAPFDDTDPATDPSGGHGKQNQPIDGLVPLVARVHAAGIAAALHAIGDAAIDDVLEVFERTGARGSVEHAQLTRPDQAARFARLGIAASVQPAHLLDDRDVAERSWGERTAWCFPLRSFLDAGADLRFGSDAPVSPLDPWLAMAAAVHRSADDRPAWHPEQALTAAEALAASTDGRGTLAVGDVADLVLLDDDPLAGSPHDGQRPAGADASAPAHADPVAAAARLRRTRVAATFVGGHPTHLEL